ncbi:MAG: hypothetical protein IKS71_06160 [Bacteroidales bacterium]|nr:hypothetical protein [Bacteroidales bacterium]
MKKSLSRAAVLGLVLVASCGLFEGQDTPQGYVKHCVGILDKQALYSNTPEWKEAKAQILSEAAGLSTFDEAHDLVSKAAHAAGGKHSQLVPPVKDTASYPEIAPEVKLLEDGILYVLLPAHSGVKVSDSLYTWSVLNFLQEHTDAPGVILDLRDNRGGNMYPMITAVSPLLPNDNVIAFKSLKRTSPIPLDYIMRVSGVSHDSIQKFPSSTPVAILTNDWTGSSGEATLICFRGLPNVRTFGAGTAGYASANIVCPLADGYQLLVTTSCDKARTGEIFCDDPILPDVETGAPLEDALSWMR